MMLGEVKSEPLCPVPPGPPSVPPPASASPPRPPVDAPSPPRPSPSPPHPAEPRVDVASSKGVFGWATLEGDTSIPYLMRADGKYVSVRMVERALLSRYPRVYPAELRDRPPLVSQYATAAEAALLSEINERHCEYEYGAERFLAAHDLLVRLTDFEQFHRLVRRNFPDPPPMRAGPAVRAAVTVTAGPAVTAGSAVTAGVTVASGVTGAAGLTATAGVTAGTAVAAGPAVTAGWVQLNNTLVPYVARGERLAPLSVLRHAAGLLTRVRVGTVTPTAAECGALNAACRRAGLAFTFPPATRLVSLHQVRLLCPHVRMTPLAADNPFGSAQYQPAVREAGGLHPHPEWAAQRAGDAGQALADSNLRGLQDVVAVVGAWGPSRPRPPPAAPLPHATYRPHVAPSRTRAPRPDLPHTVTSAATDTAAVPLICPVLLRGLTIACVVRPAASADGARQCYAPVAVLASAFFLSDCARALCDALEGRLRVRLAELSEHEEAAYFSVTSLKLACRTLVSVRQFDMHLSQLLCLLPRGATPPTAAAGKPASPPAARRPEASAVQPSLPTARRLEVGAVQPPPATSRPETGAVQPPPAKAMKAESVTPIVVTPVHRTTRRRDNGAVICID